MSDTNPDVIYKVIFGILTIAALAIAIPALVLALDDDDNGNASGLIQESSAGIMRIGNPNINEVFLEGVQTGQEADSFLFYNTGTSEVSSAPLPTQATFQNLTATLLSAQTLNAETGVTQNGQDVVKLQGGGSQLVLGHPGLTSYIFPSVPATEYAHNLVYDSGTGLVGYRSGTATEIMLLQANSAHYAANGADYVTAAVPGSVALSNVTYADDRWIVVGTGVNTNLFYSRTGTQFVADNSTGFTAVLVIENDVSNNYFTFSGGSITTVLESAVHVNTGTPMLSALTFWNPVAIVTGVGTDRGTAMILGRDGVSCRLYQTTDTPFAGVTTVAVPNVLSTPLGLAGGSDGQQLVLVDDADATILHQSIDAGATWDSVSAVAPANATLIRYMANDLYFVALSGGDYVVLTKDPLDPTSSTVSGTQNTGHVGVPVDAQWVGTRLWVLYGTTLRYSDDVAGGVWSAATLNGVTLTTGTALHVRAT